MASIFEYEAQAALPPLAWCARLGAGGPVRVLHGAGVEGRPEGFVEGAWDGPFDAFDFDRAETLAGTGARRRQGATVFAAPFHPLERLFVLRADDDDVLVSNSLVFLLVAAGDGLDLGYPDYFFDLVGSVRAGIGRPEHLPTAAGRAVEMFRCCNLVVDDGGRLRREPKPLSPPPHSYADYFAHLDRTTRVLAANAGAAERRRRYRMVAACSRGYDSTAAAALASRAGCREGVTFARGAAPVGNPLTAMGQEIGDDSGAEALRALGMSVREYQRHELGRLRGFPTAEFYLNNPAALTDAMMQLMDDVLPRSLFVSGRHGERYWGPTRRSRRRDMREVDDCHLSGHGLGELRLRLGFLHYPAPYVGALHGPALYRITHSAEMRPWKLGTGLYDRPIARRIAEEAGVPRAAFGHRKLGTGVGTPRELNAESERDFQAFLAAEVPPAVLARLDRRPLAARLASHRRLAFVRARWSHLPLAASFLDLIGSDRFHMLWRSARLYQFHWGYSKLVERYRPL